MLEVCIFLVVIGVLATGVSIYQWLTGGHKVWIFLALFNGLLLSLNAWNLGTL